ncbi:MAG: DNA primase, partial [Leptospiraceae bacterium]|nr:DNA primase [Leptospiraceae bacterium]
MTGDVSRLLEAVPIETYIGRFVPLKRKGSNFLGLCPFHSEKSPSFSVAPAKGIFKCFGCGKGGDLISFIREYERTDFRGALVILSEYSGIPLTAANPVQDNARQSRKKSAYKANILVSQWFASALLNSPASEYLTQRKVEITTSGHFGIGYAPPSNRFLEEKSES